MLLLYQSQPRKAIVLYKNQGHGAGGPTIKLFWGQAIQSMLSAYTKMQNDAGPGLEKAQHRFLITSGIYFGFIRARTYP